MTSSAVFPWNGASHGPPICLHVMVFMSLASLHRRTSSCCALSAELWRLGGPQDARARAAPYWRSPAATVATYAASASSDRFAPWAA
jgi:hypothetical protein